METSSLPRSSQDAVGKGVESVAENPVIETAPGRGHFCPNRNDDHDNDEDDHDHDHDDDDDEDKDDNKFCVCNTLIFSWDSLNLQKTVENLNNSNISIAGFASAPFTVQGLQTAILEFAKRGGTVVGYSMITQDSAIQFLNVGAAMSTLCAIEAFRNHVVAPLGQIFVVVLENGMATAKPANLSTMGGVFI